LKSDQGLIAETGMVSMVSMVKTLKPVSQLISSLKRRKLSARVSELSAVYSIQKKIPDRKINI
jgi:hypothetical protein